MKVGTTEISLKQGDITKEQVDAIVNAANCQLAGGGGVDGAIHKAGGPSIAAECKQLIAKVKKLEVGEAVLTGGGRLKAQHVIHTVGPVWSGGKKGEAEDLECAYYNALILAKEYGLKSVALPAISTGAYSYPLDQAAFIALKTARDFCLEHQGLDEIRFVLFTPEATAAFETAARELLSEAEVAA